MKKTRIIALLLALALILSCSACAGKDEGSTAAPTEATKSSETEAPTSADKETEAPTEAPTETEPHEPDAETAMDNFVKKLQAGNYLVAPENYIRTNVYSPEQITFTHEEESYADDFAFITLDGETFEGLLEDEGVTEIAFAEPENAIDTLAYLLPNYWITASGGNMWNLFYNNIDNPLEFTSNDETVKTTLLGLAGYSEMALGFMEEVHVLLDDEDPTNVRFTAHIGETGTMIHYDDLDLTLQFGAGTSDPRVEKWLSDPTYPPTRTGWTRSDVATLDLVFQKDYGVMAVPFPEFASYAMIFDDDAYQERTEVLLKDAHATEKDVEEYKALLLANGYQEAAKELADGTTESVYRKLLREEYSAYAELEPVFDNGFELTGRMHFEEQEYEGQAAINAVLAEKGFAEMPETDIFTGWKATDQAPSRSEGWLYFFDYNLYMPFILQYDDADAAQKYIDDYCRQLEKKGLKAAYAPTEERGEYGSPNGRITFKYTYDLDNTVILEFKNEKTYTPEQVNALLAEHGLPAADIHGDIAARDLTRYYYNIAEFRGLHISVYQPFDSTEDAEAFLDGYAAVLEENGYEYTNPQAVGSNRSFLFWNEEQAKYVGFDLNRGEDSATVFFEFVSIEPEEESALEGALRR